MTMDSGIKHSDLASRVEYDGFAIVPACLDESVVTQICGSMDDDKYGRRNLLGDPIVQQVALSNAVRSVVASVLGPVFFAVKATFFNKTPSANWKVPWHQDLTITVRDRINLAGFGPWTVKDGVLNVQPPVEILTEILAVRIHLDINDGDNGPLRVIPGSHRYGRLSIQQIADWDKSDCVTCLVPRAGALLMRPLLLHASSASKVAKNRRVIHLEFATEELPGGLKWHTKI